MRSSTSMPRRRDRQPERLEPVDVRPAAGRDEQPVERRARCRPRASALPLVDAARPARRGGCRRRPRAAPSATSAAASASTRERMRASPCDERHLRADALEELRELAADRARRRARRAAPGTSRRLGRLDVRPVVDRLEPVDRRDRRRRAGRDHEPVVRAAPCRRPGRRPARRHVASPRTSSASCDASHSTCEESSRSATMSRHAKIFCGSSVAGCDRAERARVRPRASSGARSIVFVGMHAQ